MVRPFYFFSCRRINRNYMRRSVLLKNNSEHLILSHSLLKKFETESFDVLSVPGAHPKDMWDFIPLHNKYKKMILFIGGNSLGNFVSKSGAFTSAQEPVQVAIEIFEIAFALTSRKEEVFIVGVPPRGRCFALSLRLETSPKICAISKTKLLQRLTSYSTKKFSRRNSTTL